MNDANLDLPTIEAEWAEFVAEMMPDFTDEEREPYRKCFLAGFLSMLAIAFRVSNRGATMVERGKILRGYYEQHTKAAGE